MARVNAVHVVWGLVPSSVFPDGNIGRRSTRVDALLACGGGRIQESYLYLPNTFQWNTRWWRRSILVLSFLGFLLVCHLVLLLNCNSQSVERFRGDF